MDSSQFSINNFLKKVVDGFQAAVKDIFWSEDSSSNYFLCKEIRLDQLTSNNDYSNDNAQILNTIYESPYNTLNEYQQTISKGNETASNTIDKQNLNNAKIKNKSSLPMKLSLSQYDNKKEQFHLISPINNTFLSKKHLREEDNITKEVLSPKLIRYNKKAHFETAEKKTNFPILNNLMYYSPVDTYSKNISNPRESIEQIKTKINETRISAEQKVKDYIDKNYSIFNEKQALDNKSNIINNEFNEKKKIIQNLVIKEEKKALQKEYNYLQYNKVNCASLEILSQDNNKELVDNKMIHNQAKFTIDNKKNDANDFIIFPIPDSIITKPTESFKRKTLLRSYQSTNNLQQLESDSLIMPSNRPESIPNSTIDNNKEIPQLEHINPIPLLNHIDNEGKILDSTKPFLQFHNSSQVSNKNVFINSTFTPSNQFNNISL